MSGGGQSGSDGQTLTYSCGERQREHDLHQHQHAGQRGHHHLRLGEQWDSDLRQLVDLHGPVGTPSNTITLTVTDSNSSTSTATGQVNITTRRTTAHFSMSGAGRAERRADPDLQPAVNGSVSMTFTSTSTQGSAAITTLRLGEQWDTDLQQLVDCTARSGRRATPSH